MLEKRVCMHAGSSEFWARRPRKAGSAEPPEATVASPARSTGFAGGGRRRGDSTRSFEEARVPRRSAVSSPAMTRADLLKGPMANGDGITARLSGALLQAVDAKVCSHACLTFYRSASQVGPSVRRQSISAASHCSHPQTRVER